MARLSINELVVGDTRYLVAADHVLESGLGAVKHSLIGHCAMLLALEEKVLPPKTAIHFVGLR